MWISTLLRGGVATPGDGIGPSCSLSRWNFFSFEPALLFPYSLLSSNLLLFLCLITFAVPMRECLGKNALASPYFL